MLIQDFLTSRKSTRKFKTKAISGDTLKGVEDLVHGLSEKCKNVNFSLETDGKGLAKSLEGKAGYGGVMIEAPAYVLMRLEDDRESFVRGAYYLESIITGLKKFNLGSCWVTTIPSKREEIDSAVGTKGGTLHYLLAIGYPARQLDWVNPSYSTRIALEDYVFDKELGEPIDVKDLEKSGLADVFYYLRLAPSSFNKQGWRFVVDSGKIDLYMEGEDSADAYVDAGIVMYYFDQMVKTFGILNDWELDIKQSTPYIKIAHTKV